MGGLRAAARTTCADPISDQTVQQADTHLCGPQSHNAHCPTGPSRRRPSCPSAVTRRASRAGCPALSPSPPFPPELCPLQTIWNGALRTPHPTPTSKRTVPLTLPPSLLHTTPLSARVVCMGTPTAGRLSAPPPPACARRQTRFPGHSPRGPTPSHRDVDPPSSNHEGRGAEGASGHTVPARLPAGPPPLIPCRLVGKAGPSPLVRCVGVALIRALAVPTPGRLSADRSPPFRSGMPPPFGSRVNRFPSPRAAHPTIAATPRHNRRASNLPRGRPGYERACRVWVSSCAQRAHRRRAARLCSLHHHHPPATPLCSPSASASAQRSRRAAFPPSPPPVCHPP